MSATSPRTRLMLCRTSIAGKCAAIGQRAAEPEMAVDDSLDGIGDRLVEIVAFDQHGVKARDRPRRLRRRARGFAEASEKTLGGNPLVAGGSRAARPICRWAWHRRVRESISSRTFFPSSRKNSATVQATLAARTRSSGASSPVLTITTQRRMPSSPRLFWRNSCTSRPRSPIRATTETSALVCLAIWPSSVLLPTPGPEKIPMRWPRPQVCRPSMARTLVAIGWSMLMRDIGATERASMRRRVPIGSGGFAVDRLAEAVEHAAEHAWEH